MTVLRIGTRGSALAMAQTQLVRDAIHRLHPGLEVSIERITTTGDAHADVPLAQLGRGVFVTEIESALREGRIDLAVHSAKDLPSTLAPDLEIAAFLQREDARDVLVSRAGGICQLPGGARVGTSSPRRASLLRAMRPDIETCDIRGNVDTRLRKLHDGEFDAIVLAAAGLIRLGRAHEVTEWLDPESVIPSVGQGALALEVRRGDERALTLLRALDDAGTRIAVMTERAFLAELGAGCRAAAAAHARVLGGGIAVTAFIGGPDGRHVRATRRSNVANVPAGEDLGSAISRELLRQGGAGFLAQPEGPLLGRTIAVTRPAAQNEALAALLGAYGANVVCCPTIAIASRTSAELDRALATLPAVTWMVFTSANAVAAVGDRMDSLHRRMPGSLRVAAVGGATAIAARSRFGRVDFTPGRANAETLAQELPVLRGEFVFFPRGNLARETLAAMLKLRGAVVRDVVVYDTHPSPQASELADLVRAGQLDAVIFTSPSSVRFATKVAVAFRLRASSAPVVACIGATTAAAARDLGIAPDVVAETPSVGALVERLAAHFSSTVEVTA